MIGDFLFLSRVKRQLIDGTLRNLQAFIYFHNHHLCGQSAGKVSAAISPSANPLDAVLRLGRLGLGGVFLIATYMFNGGAAGRDYLVRYFSISAVVVLWIAIPFELAISLPAVAPSLAAIDWYVAAIISITNIFYFSFVALQIRDVAMRSRLSVV